MRLLVATVALLVGLALPAQGAPMEQPDEWTVWADDGRDDPVDLAPGDIDQVRIGTTAANLHLELTTFPATSPPALRSSRVEFDVQDVAWVLFDWGSEPQVFVGGEAKEGWQVAEGSGPFGWHVQIPWSLIGVDPTTAFVVENLDASTSLYVPRDTATGPPLSFVPGASGGLQVSQTVPSLRPGTTVEGPDYAGGASVTIGSAGKPVVAYYIYDGERGDPRGIYLGRIEHGALVPERLADTHVSREGGRDGQMRTQVAYDGRETFVLYTDRPAVDNDEDGPGDPGVADSVYVLARAAGQWVGEDPTPGGASDVGPEDVADLVARDGRLVAAVPVGDDVWVVERKGPAQWEVRHRIGGATNAKLALDSKGAIHVAYAVYGSDSGSWRDGKLYYASSASGFEVVHVGDNIDSGWEGPETDGSYAIAVGPHDEVALLWNDGRSESRDEEQRVAVRSAAGWRYDFAPLVPGHGNPQYTMRLGFAADGTLVAASGYGGTDTLAARSDGGWAALALDRYDVWDMAVAPDGTTFFAYTQPHGGTTLAVTAYGTMVGDDVEESDWTSGRGIPGPAPMLLALAFLVLAVRRR